MTKVICPKAGECDSGDCICKIPHEWWKDQCEPFGGCPACIPLPEKEEKK